MTNEQEKARELAKLLNAFADEKQLEWFNQSKWIEIPIGCLLKTILVDYNIGVPFRIKPETKRIALNKQDLIDRIKENKTMWVKYGTMVSVVTNFKLSSVYLIDEEFTYEHFAEFEWLDNSPCYKEVECE